MIKNVIFDVDGTIWDSTPIVAEGWNRAVKETGYTHTFITPQMLKQEFGKTMDVIADDLFGDVTDPEKRKKLLDRCCEYEQKALEENQQDIAYEGMYETMTRLCSQYRLYIVSNCQCGYIELVLEKNHMTHLFTDFACFGHTGKSKGETMKILMERNGLTKEDSVYIGDTTGDKEAAEVAGLPFIFAAYGFGEVTEADACIHSYGELEQVLENF